jgi:hypothetical protein
MAMLKAADFYYGAFLSALLNYAGKKPSLFDETESRRIYKITTQNSTKDYIVFTKAVNEKKNKSNNFRHWSFRFTQDEVDTLQRLNLEFGNVKLSLICFTDDLSDGEIAFIDYSDAIECMGVTKNITPYRINIKVIKNKSGLRMYGSGRSDILDGKDNTIHLSRNALKDL